MSQPPPERTLLEASAVSDRRKLLGDLFMSHRERLRRLVDLRLDPRLRKRLDPSDVLQETYLEAQRRLQDYLTDAPQPLFLWLRGIAIQKLIDLRRKHLLSRRRDVRLQRSIDAPLPGASSQNLAETLATSLDSPIDFAIKKENLKRLCAALDRLPETDREILEIRHLEQLSNGEAAQVMGISTSAASKRHCRALDALKELMEESDSPRPRR